ncbi:MAG: hypothetical protein MZU91_08700 [Desulfosudis oleivorans]|nr:hypothetical protein [Desulfosudis oleivorans]
MVNYINKRFKACDNRTGSDLLLHFVDKISRISPGRAVLKTGITGNAPVQDVRRFSLHEKFYFAYGLVLIVIDITAL